MSEEVKTILGVGFYVVLGIAGDLLLSRGMRRMRSAREGRGPGAPGFFRHIVTTREVLLGIGCLAMNFTMLLGLLSYADVSVVIPSRALTYLLTTMLARWMLAEYVPPRRWMGAALVSVGVALVLSTTGR